MRFTAPLVIVLTALAVSAYAPAAAAGTDQRAERLTNPSADPAWNMDNLRELGDDSGIRDRHGLTVDQLKGMAIVNVAGEMIGRIEEVLSDENDEVIAITADVGGFLGIGAKEVIVGVDRLELRRDQFATAMSPEELRQQPEWDD